MRQFLTHLGAIAMQLLYRRTIFVLTVIFCTGVATALWNMSHLSSRLIASQATDNAALYAEAITEARTLYSSEAVDRVEIQRDIPVTHDYLDRPGAIPLPATYLMKLSDRLASFNEGMSVRLYSDYPFPWRQSDGGARDAFEREALQYLQEHPQQTFSRIEPFQGHSALRYAQADILKPSCLECHNTHPDSPKTDWQVGDVRGILEVTLPLDRFMQQTRQGLQSTFAMLAGLSVLGVSGLGVTIARLRQTSKELERRVVERTAQLQQANTELTQEQEKSERLLLNILPKPIAHRLKQGDENIAEGFADVTVLFADLVGFTQLSARVSPTELVALLNHIFSEFDRLSDLHGLEKIKTIGDAYMVVGGLPTPRGDHAAAIANMALDMQAAIAKFNLEREEAVSLRIGINTGPAIAGVIGTKKFIYDLWGDAVNTASRMESHGIAGCIQVSEATYRCLHAQFELERRGRIRVKGKGEMTTYLLVGRKVDNTLSRDRLQAE